jgi:hypothetical protein
MDGRRPHALTSASLTRRQALQLAAGAAALGLTGCAPSAREATQEQQQGSMVLLSTQFQPVAEAEKMRSAVLPGFGRKVEFLGEEQGPFLDRIQAEAQAGKGSVAVIGGQHGDLVGLAARELLTDLSDLTQELAGRGFNPDYPELAKVGGDTPVYIPWAQASYLMVARKEAVGLLPSGADVNALTYEQLTAWGSASSSRRAPGGSASPPARTASSGGSSRATPTRASPARSTPSSPAPTRRRCGSGCAAPGRGPTRSRPGTRSCRSRCSPARCGWPGTTRPG